MMQQHSLTFTLKEKSYKVPTFKHLTNISPTISDSLIFNQNHSYQVESNTSEEVFQSFVEYLIEGQIPEINLDNINEFIELSNEFNLLKDEIETKKEEYGEYLINLNFLRFEKTKDVSKYEANVAEHLDEYIESYSSSLMQIPIQTLYNIFNHQQRRLTKHNEAYECIKAQFEKSNDSNIFILLESIDGHKLTKNNLEESISLRNARNNHIPDINFTYISNIIDKQKEYEKKISKLEEELVQFQNDTRGKIENQEEEIKNIENKHQQYQKETETKIVNQDNSIQELKRIIEEKDKILQELNQKIESLTNKIDEKTALIEKQHQKNQAEIKAKLSSQEGEIQKLTKIIEENSTKYEGQLKTLEDKFTGEIEKLDQKIVILTNTNNLNEINLNEKIGKSQELYKKDIINEMKRETLSLIGHSACNSFTNLLSLTDPGIFQILKMKEKTKFDNLFIASQSSDDIYNLINPNNTGKFGTCNENGFFIEFEFKEKLSINGFKIFTSNSNFPKSFNIEVDGKTVSSIKNAKELNGEYKDMTINFEPAQTQKVRFISTDYNWGNKNYFINIKRIELLSNEAKYSKGVFSTLIAENIDHDPHKIGVIISAKYFDYNSFYSIEAPYCISTSNIENSWFQIELTRGLVIIKGFRLKRKANSKLKRYKMICTDDIKKPVELWTTVFEIDEQNENEHQLLDIYEFKQPSPPAKYIRLVQTGKNWNNELFITFLHFDVFGTYF